MRPEDRHEALRARIRERLETVVDPCSVAAGAGAGLVSMGLVGDIALCDRADGTHVAVTLFITSPTCIMAAIFEEAAAREIRALPGVARVTVRTDRTHLWHSDEMTPEYRQQLSEYRAAQARAHAARQSAAAAQPV